MTPNRVQIFVCVIGIVVILTMTLWALSGYVRYSP